MGLVGGRSGLNHPGVKGYLAHQGKFRRIGNALQIRHFEQFVNVGRKVRKCFNCIAEHGMAPGVGILDVEDRIVPRLLDDLGQIEVEHGVVLAEQHHEADRIAADFIHHLAKRDELPRPLRHFYRLAGPHQLHQLNEFDVEHRLAAA